MSCRYTSLVDDVCAPCANLIIEGLDKVGMLVKGLCARIWLLSDPEQCGIALKHPALVRRVGHVTRNSGVSQLVVSA